MTERWLVVGAGSAGCVAAARLSEDPHRDVVLLEDGPDLRPGSVPDEIAGGDYLAAIGSDGRTHRGLTARRSVGAPPTTYPTGRGVGGSSAVNGMVVMRGSPEQYRRWGWDDADEAWARVAVPVEVPADDELGVVDRALLASAPDAERAPLTRRERRRVTSAEAYLWPAEDRPNLAVRSGSPVARVALDRRRAVGVVLGDGSEVAADHVVLAAGAIHGPAILLRSGVEAPGVGEGLRDHPSVAVTLHLRGPVPAPGGLVSGAMLNRGGVQILSMNRIGSTHETAGLGQLVVALMRTHGAGGRVALDTDDPSGPPDVRFDLLDDPADLAGMRDAVGLLRSLLDAPAFRSVVDAVTIDEHGTPIDALDDGGTLDRWLRTSPGAYVHASSSCAMGRTVADDGSVVGYERLYVCDASVFPSIPDANTHLPTTMLAERLAARW